ncbi:hypothetical protein OAR00_01530 [Alphaproteobacteria bacterium]|nr:hypothetical protein [Alphaproteobacteria bacterium]
MRSIILIIFLMLLIKGCTGPLAIIGQIYGGADTITSLTTGKSATDTIISKGSNKDCRIHRIFKDKPVCLEKSKKTNIKNKEENNDHEVDNKQSKSISEKIRNFFKFNNK